MKLANPCFKKTIYLIIFKSFFAAFALLYLPIGLAPDEAQYWTWSQNLSFAYYSKPPWIAWQIYLGTALFSNTEWAIRSPSLVISAGITLSMYLLAKNLKLKATGRFASALMMSVCPIGILASFAATTDAPLILCWTLSAALFVRDLDEKNAKSLEKIALLIALGALCKWPIYALWLFILPYSWLYLDTKPYRLIKCLSLSLLGLLPSLYWNIENNWGTFRHVYSSVIAPANNEGGNAIEFLASQMGTLSPIFYVLSLMAIFQRIKKIKNNSAAESFCLSLSLFFWLLCHSLSFFNKVQANWAVCAYPTAIVLAAKLIEEKAQLKVLYRWGTVLSLVISCLALSIPSLQENNIAAIPYRINPFRHSMGWKNFSKLIEKSDYDPRQHFLFADTYQTCSILNFYGPKQKKAYFLNLSIRRQNQFSYWPGMKEEQLGKTGFFISFNNDPPSPKQIDNKKSELMAYFSEVDYLGSHAIFYNNNEPVKFARIYRCITYNGKLPKSSSLY